MTFFEDLPNLVTYIGKKVHVGGSVTGILDHIRIDLEDCWYVIKTEDTKTVLVTGVVGIEEVKE